jgi:hypothetical protein
MFVKIKGIDKLVEMTHCGACDSDYSKDWWVKGCPYCRGTGVIGPVGTVVWRKKQAYKSSSNNNRIAKD